MYKAKNMYDNWKKDGPRGKVTLVFTHSKKEYILSFKWQLRGNLDKYTFSYNILKRF